MPDDIYDDDFRARDEAANARITLDFFQFRHFPP